MKYRKKLASWYYLRPPMFSMVSGLRTYPLTHGSNWFWTDIIEVHKRKYILKPPISHLLANIARFFSLAKFSLVVFTAFALPTLAVAPVEANLARDCVLARPGVLHALNMIRLTTVRLKRLKVSLTVVQPQFVPSHPLSHIQLALLPSSSSHWGTPWPEHAFPSLPFGI